MARLGCHFKDAVEPALYISTAPSVTRRLVVDAKTGDPKGFAFCEYFDVASVQNAIRMLNNRDVMGRKIRIDYGTDQATTGMEGKPGGHDLEITCLDMRDYLGL